MKNGRLDTGARVVELRPGANPHDLMSWMTSAHVSSIAHTVGQLERLSTGQVPASPDRLLAAEVLGDTLNIIRAWSLEMTEVVAELQAKFEAADRRAETLQAMVDAL